VVLGRGSWPLGSWDREFESCFGHGCCPLVVELINRELCTKQALKMIVDECSVKKKYLALNMSEEEDHITTDF
jgi:hypothetical protein